MRLRSVLNILLLSLLLAPVPLAAQTLDQILTGGDRLTHADYEVTRSYNAQTERSTATISRRGRVLATFNEGGGPDRDSTRIGLFSLLGGGTQQLIIEQYSGGAHCCWRYWIYNLTPVFRRIYDSAAYGANQLGYQLNIADLNRSGQYELIQSVMSFDYFELPHAQSPFPPAVFQYQWRSGRYQLANRRFPDYVLRDVAEHIREVQGLNRRLNPGSEQFRENYLAAMLQVVLKYIYAGREREAWEFYDREYRLPDKEEMRGKIRRQLRTSAIYNALYRRQ